MNVHKIITLSAAMLVAGLVSLKTSEATAAITFKFTEFVVPGEVTPAALGLNNAGTIVGNCNEPNNTTLLPGFMRSNGVFSIVVLPANVAGGYANNNNDTQDLGQLVGINDAGIAVGDYSDSQGNWHNFLRTADGVIHYLPNAPETYRNSGTILFKINNNGLIVGTTGYGGYSIAQTNSNFRGCLLNGTNYTLFDFPGAFGTQGRGINDQNAVVGAYFDASGNRHGFLSQGGTNTTVDFPKATSTWINNINNAGQIVGAYILSNNQHGFLLSNGVYTTVDFPGQPAGTALWDINNRGEVVGNYNNQANSFYATIVVPVSTTKLQLVAAGGGIQLQIQGPAGGRWQVQASANLATWSALGSVVTNTASPTIISVPGPMSALAFFRLVSVP